MDQLPVTENSPLNVAESPYAYTKQIGERIIEDFIKSEDSLKAVSLRYFNPVGAHVSGLNGEIQPVPNNLVPFITQTAIGKRTAFSVYGNDYETRDGTCIRDYIHVSDIAHAHVLAVKHLAKETSQDYDVINLGTGNGVSVLELIRAFEEVNGLNLNYSIGPRREGDVEEIYANSEKALQLLNWKPELDLKSMMKSAWLWEQHMQQHNIS